MNQSKARRPPPPEFHPSKKVKTGPPASFEISLTGGGDASADMSWRNFLKCQKRSDVSADTQIRTAWDSRYPLNKVLNGATGSADPEKVASMGGGSNLGFREDL